ncbi:hypothetical protein [Stenotrophomonas maltophilia]|uniref:hypothetical protein n=1 Tax=Stenotrophomonas maltophilia TaxID=40324 RepID=UPI00128BAD65|nr:hypothetical protein [Stenotrophomonas maltophilia]ELK2665271.1 hypothetical protein [Stenotrophomonas maltophilia]MBH1376189.1 hypothetical protein [Stenotrophomonas maltophilia]MBH1439130.1 hypothetical protein [Stenotrophomonas maltophilia]MBH1557871.1 hypothetical protein [Stenotrophomonas maltophilia]MBN4986020.1 hypothetical protein [Stenotrophomonas maltophilia]
MTKIEQEEAFARESRAFANAYLPAAMISGLIFMMAGMPDGPAFLLSLPVALAVGTVVSLRRARTQANS